MTPEQLQRVELLKLQKELQRREKEREAWRLASAPRNVFTEKKNIEVKNDPDSGFTNSQIESLFFAKLRLGKLLE